MKFMSIRIVLVFCLIVGFICTAQGQQENTDAPRTCATMEQDSINKIRYPQRKTLDDFEEDDGSEEE